MGISEKIKHYRKAIGMNQITLAEKLSVSQSTITAWECGTRIPDIAALSAIADIFSTTTDDMLGRETMDSNKFMTE